MPPDPLGVSDNLPNPEWLLSACLTALVISLPVGVVFFLIIRLFTRRFSVIWAGMLTGWVISFVTLTALIVQLAPGGTAGVVEAAVASFVVTSGIAFVIAYIMRRELERRAQSLEDPSDFSVFGESAKDRKHRFRRWR